MAAGFALSVSAAACGDDDDDDTGGSGGGGGSSGAKAGSGGTGGNKAGSGGGGSGGSVSAAMCITDTKTATANMQAPACIECICEAAADRTTVEACNKQAMCWPLISCVATKCSGQDPNVCAPAMCADNGLLGGATTATPVGMLLQGKCASKCPAPGDDAGTPDAGN